MDQVTIAAIEGFCIGGAVALAVALDFRIMASDAHMRAPEIALGMNMSWQTIPRMLQLICPARQAAMELAEKVAAQASLPVAMTKQTVNRLAGALDDLASHMDLDQLILTCMTEDHNEGNAAFREKRKPRFKER